MRLDLLAADLFNLLRDLWPYYDKNHSLAEMHLEDAMKLVAEEERFRIIEIIQEHIATLERRRTPYATNAANCLKDTIDRIKQREESCYQAVVGPEELDEYVP